MIRLWKKATADSQVITVIINSRFSAKMEPVEIARHLVDNWWHGANDPAIQSATIKVRLREQNWKPIRLFLARWRRTKQHFSFKFVRCKLPGFIGILDADVVGELSNWIQTFLLPTIGQKQFIPTICLVRLFNIHKNTKHITLKFTPLYNGLSFWKLQNSVSNLNNYHTADCNPASYP